MLDRASRTLAPLGPTEAVVYEYGVGPEGRTLPFFFGDTRTPVSLHRLDLKAGALERLLEQDRLEPEDALVHETHTRETAGGTLRIYVYSPPGAAAGSPRPGVVWRPGSGGDSPRWNPYVQYPAQAGFVVATFN